ncbi:PASTA domain-containing protein [Streptosporangiaceae bacterium NEAU-GS5]|nr:PASTA domain-containing protein [Streptosporangiaceae bacterium NEAU-GS5]
MNVEEALKDAMTAQVHGVQAPPSMAQQVRRRRRSHMVRFRTGTAGVAVLTAAVAGAVPFVLHDGSPAPAKVGAAPTAAPTGETTAIPGVVVPNLAGMNGKQAFMKLRALGLTAKIETRPGPAESHDMVLETTPEAGAVVPEKSSVTIVIVSNAPTEPPQTVELPQDLGDLGDGRTFGGMHLGYLPEGLSWGHWSGKNGFGDKSYTTTFVVPGVPDGEYSVQVVVFTGAAAANASKKGDEVAKNTYLASLGEGGEVSKDPSATRTISRFLRPDFAVEVMMSPNYGGKLDKADDELKKIAAGITLVK